MDPDKRDLIIIWVVVGCFVVAEAGLALYAMIVAK